MRPDQHAPPTPVQGEKGAAGEGGFTQIAAARNGGTRRIRPVMLGLAAAALAAVIAVGVLAFAGGSKTVNQTASRGRSAAGRGPVPASGSASEVSAQLAGVPQRGNTLGNPKAPLTVKFFGDLQCPYCRRFALGALPSLIERYVRRGRMKMEYHSLETATRDPQVFITQQLAALAAGRQNKMWNFIELFYLEQGPEDSGYVTESYLQGLAQQVSGLNLPSWMAARGDASLLNTLRDDARTASSRGLTSTPAFLLRTDRDRRDAAAIAALLRS
ncbi:MAG TPA: thioredoxin domain-containing protein [Myxococcaceae bacterium]|nr:thioredoxin domain-containing protein [Myxococcaceae bacterium]